MKYKLLLLVAFLALILSPGSSRAQTCTPDQAIGNALMYPAKLPFAMAGYYYYNTLTFRVPADSLIPYGSSTIHATVDSAKLINIKGIPSGYVYNCNTPNCVWPGGQLGCALFLGQVASTDTAAVKEYPITIYIFTWFHSASTSMTRLDSSTNYSFKIVAYTGAPEISKYEPLSVYPNPASQELNVQLRNLSQESTLTITDLTGKTIYTRAIPKPASFLEEEKIDLSGFEKGLYVVMLRSGERVLTQKVMLK